MRWLLPLLIACSGGDGDETDDTDQACATWLVEYDLTGTTFAIDAVFDFEITLQEPYDDDLNMGPGTLTLRVPDVDGAPGGGPAQIVAYHATQDFVTGVAGLVEVHTELQTDAEDACGVATGVLAGHDLAWSPATLSPFCQDGQISCTGSLCGSGGSPPEGEPVVYDNVCGEQALGAFAFTDGLASFTAAPTVVQQDEDSTSTLTLVGTQTSAVLEAAPPACACD